MSLPGQPSSPAEVNVEASVVMQIQRDQIADLTWQNTLLRAQLNTVVTELAEYREHAEAQKTTTDA